MNILPQPTEVIEKESWFSTELVSEIKELALDTLEEWLIFTNAPEDVKKLVHLMSYLQETEYFGPDAWPDAFGSQHFDFEVGTCLAQLLDLITGIKIAKFPVPALD
jgi:hypothetical protein